MFDLNFFAALAVFCFVMYASPGPNNGLILASGLRFGFPKTIPYMVGITIGHVIQLSLVCFGLGGVFHIFPEIQSVLKIVCAIYLLYLGYKILGSLSKINEDASQPLRFHEAALFQLVNPKALTISSMVTSGFLPKDSNLSAATLFIASTALIICPLSMVPWPAFDSEIKKFIKNKMLKTLIEYALALLLLVTALAVIFQK